MATHTLAKYIANNCPLLCMLLNQYRQTHIEKFPVLVVLQALEPRVLWRSEQVLACTQAGTEHWDLVW